MNPKKRREIQILIGFVLLGFFISVWLLSATTASTPISAQTLNSDPVLCTLNPTTQKSESYGLVASEHKTYLVKWYAEPSQIPVNQYFSMEFSIDEKTQRINYEIDISLEAGMDAHNHGMNTKPLIQRLDKNRFRAVGMLFHMAGTWQVYLDISRGLMREKVKIEVTI